MKEKNQKAPTDLLKRIVSELERAKKPAGFCTQGSFDFDGVQISIKGVGRLRPPFRVADARILSQVAVQAPYGKKTETLVDTNVRDTLEIRADIVTYSEQLHEEMKGVLANIATQLHLDHDRLECELYKLLIYTKGGFFLPHRDSEKKPGMVATLIVVLPSKFNGGDLLVQHDGRFSRFAFDAARSQTKAEYVAFFADCQHEVKKVTSGIRLCLAYNLMLKPKSKSVETKGNKKSDARLRQAIEGWIAKRAEKPMVFALEHLYTSDGLVPSLLKGADSQLFAELVSVAEDVQCKLHFGQVSRHLCQYADDGSFQYGRRGRRRPSVDYSELNIGEVYDDEIVIDGWKDSHGKSIRLPSLACDEQQLISITPVEKWVPTEQDYEGYTGNAGNTLDRWYHKSAIALWPSSQQFNIIAQMGIKYAIEQFLKLVAKREKLKGEKRESTTAECIQLAGAILQRWPDRTYVDPSLDDKESLHAKFAEAVPTLENLELIGGFLRTVAQRDRHLTLIQFIQIALKVKGGDAIFPLLKDLLDYEQPPNEYGIVFHEGLAERDALWLCKLTQSKVFGKTTEVATLIDIAIYKTRALLVKLEKKDYRSRSGPLTSAWLQLIRACIHNGDEKRLQNLLGLSSEFPQSFDLRAVQVPAAIKLKAWSAKADAERSEAFVDWTEAIRKQLERDTEIKPQLPTDQARRAVTDCKCEYCDLLSQFLRDPQQSQIEIKAAERDRRHLEHILQSKRLDVTSKQVRMGNRYALQFTKTTDSYHRELKRYEADLKLITSLKAT